MLQLNSWPSAISVWVFRTDTACCSMPNAIHTYTMFTCARASYMIIIRIIPQQFNLNACIRLLDKFLQKCNYCWLKWNWGWKFSKFCYCWMRLNTYHILKRVQMFIFMTILRTKVKQTEKKGEANLIWIYHDGCLFDCDMTSSFIPFRPSSCRFYYICCCCCCLLMSRLPPSFALYSYVCWYSSDFRCARIANLSLCWKNPRAAPLILVVNKLLSLHSKWFDDDLADTIEFQSNLCVN